MGKKVLAILFTIGILCFSRPALADPSSVAVSFIFSPDEQSWYKSAADRLFIELKNSPRTCITSRVENPGLEYLDFIDPTGSLSCVQKINKKTGSNTASCQVSTTFADGTLELSKTYDADCPGSNNADYRAKAIVAALVFKPLRLWSSLEENLLFEKLRNDHETCRHLIEGQAYTRAFYLSKERSLICEDQYDNFDKKSKVICYLAIKIENGEVSLANVKEIDSNGSAEAAVIDIQGHCPL